MAYEWIDRSSLRRELALLGVDWRCYWKQMDSQIAKDV
ncbi:hypothetical protein SAMN05444168_6575 [Paraburkholderia phenazinium]|uniref:Uncharacterized protein n=1 Tax=Paraburkholderia phenazinium TaxID=60549 RepID=A0A1N6KAC9_9BURK|nr:hypothetical protein SAMN05444168_6575 [Paraburkholderia phenazinium]